MGPGWTGSQLSSRRVFVLGIVMSSVMNGKVWKWSAAGPAGMRAHKSVEVHTGTGKNSATNLNWRHKPPSSTSYVWNNDGRETATLKNVSGKTIDSRGYTGGSVSGAAQVFYKP